MPCRAVAARLAGVLLCITASVSAERPPVQSALTGATRIQRLQRWCLEALEHAPGKADASADTVAAWPANATQLVVQDMLEVRARLARAYQALDEHHSEPPVVAWRDWSGSIAEAEYILGVTQAEAGRHDVSGVARRAALLHTDIAVLLPPSGGCLTPGRPSPVQFIDGREGAVLQSPHWDIAALLVGNVADDFVRLWYRATSAYLLATWKLSSAEPHLERARKILPGDPVIAFDSGCMHEMFASARIQSIVRTAAPGSRYVVDTPSKHLEQADRFLREALDGDRRAITLAHHGRVLGLLERHAVAAGTLRAAASAADDPLVLFFAQMFLGDEEQALGHAETARACYRRAASLYPHAQSPQIALSQLERRYGDRAAAARATDRAFEAVRDESRRYDPWFDYPAPLVQDAEALLDQWRVLVPPGDER
jgi:tetratricopeptide (TPR) repeat protein